MSNKRQIRCGLRAENDRLHSALGRASALVLELERVLELDLPPEPSAGECETCGGTDYIHHESCEIPGCDHEEPCPSCTPDDGEASNALD